MNMLKCNLIVVRKLIIERKKDIFLLNSLLVRIIILHLHRQTKKILKNDVEQQFAYYLCRELAGH